MPGILIDCLRKYQRLSQTPLESTRAPVHFLMLGGAGQAVPIIDAYCYAVFSEWNATIFVESENALKV